MKKLNFVSCEEEHKVAVDGLAASDVRCDTKKRALSVMDDGAKRNQHENQQGEQQSAPMTAKKDKLVLVVDDDALTQLIMIEMVKAIGYQAKAADDGWTGLSQIHKVKPAAVIMDMSMPHLDGFAATLLIREMYTKRELPIIACTAERSVSHRKRGFAYGMNDWLHKPVHLMHLRPILRRWLEAKPYEIVEPVSDVESLNYLPTCDHRVLELVYSKGKHGDSFAARKKFVNDFLTDAPGILNQASAAIKNNALAEAATAIRKLKQISVIAGAPRLSRLCEILDRVLTHTQPQQANKKNGAMVTAEEVSIRQVREEFLKLKEVLERRYGLFGSGSTAAFPTPGHNATANF